MTSKLKRIPKADPLSKSEGPQQIALTISWKTILKVLLAILLAVLAVELRHFFADLFLALLIGITLWPLISWARKLHWPDWLSVSCTTLLLLGLIGLGLGLLVPTVTREGAALVESLPKFKSELLKQIPSHGAVHNLTQELLNSPVFTDPKPLLEKILAFGSVALNGIIEFLIIVITAIYFLSDGERVYRWLLAFLPERHRQKVKVASSEIITVVSAYMGGQLITSLLCGGFVFSVLTILHVPDATFLAVLAGLFDVLPLIGFFMAVIPAAAAASFVSPMTALTVAILYSAYHIFENYFIVPRVYGRRLGLSALTVLVCCMMAGVVAGVIGIIMVLPIVASYPIVERIWLRRHLEPGTVEKHETLDEQHSD